MSTGLSLLGLQWTTLKVMKLPLKNHLLIVSSINRVRNAKHNFQKPKMTCFVPTNRRKLSSIFLHLSSWNKQMVCFLFNNWQFLSCDVLTCFCGLTNHFSTNYLKLEVLASNTVTISWYKLLISGMWGVRAVGLMWIGLMWICTINSLCCVQKNKHGHKCLVCLNNTVKNSKSEKHFLFNVNWLAL